MKSLFYFQQIFILIVLLASSSIQSARYIRPGGNLQLGDNIAEICLAKILSLKYNIPLTCPHMGSTDLFVLHDTEQQLEEDPRAARIYVQNEQDIINNKGENVIFWTNVHTKIGYIDPDWIAQIKKMLQLREVPIVNDIPKDMITIAVHIRKGNGGGQYYDGQQNSQQLFDFDQSKIKYVTKHNYPFEWPTFNRPAGSICGLSPKSITNPALTPVDRIQSWETKFPPDQYYVDQIKKISFDLNHPQLYVQIFTDDKNPETLTDHIKKAVNLPNITFHYENNRNESFRDQMAKDLHSMTQFDILIRPHSYFSIIAETMSEHKVVIYPLSASWIDNKLIMNTIVIKGSIENLIKKK